MKSYITILCLIITFSITGQSQCTFVENSYPVNIQITPSTSQVFYVPISGAHANAPIVNVEAKFTYIAYNGIQNYVSVRFNKGSDPGNCL